MDDKTAEIINKLAEKLGTTAEHLWSVLIRQAPWSSAIDLLVLMFYIGVAGILYYLAYRSFRKFKEDSEEGWILAGAIVALFAIIMSTVVCACVNEMSVILSGFFNPEYWALKQLVK